MSLTDTKVKNAKPSEKAVKLTDGFGLYLLVHPNGSKYWQLGYRFEGKQKVFSIGVYPAVSLADARQRRDEAKSKAERWQAGNKKFRLLFLPTYSPWLNPIERLWLSLHETITRNGACGSYWNR
ncbi:hypothetical protein BrE312_2788 [Brenneria sp. EniD312]|nr:hypothetical protein BrE312_2788 [Brenneria sp. EniD312]